MRFLRGFSSTDSNSCYVLRAETATDIVIKRMSNARIQYHQQISVTNEKRVYDQTTRS